ncbi:MAG: hypothetical protein LBQ22_03980 [Bacteroidales bacterium]|jgi:mRNA interferase RelE/StbE|nr:hypothetical protein [Bacteroidales bacterium]
MNVELERKFLKDIPEIRSVATLDNIEKIISIVETAKKVNDIPNIKKLKGHKTAYRIRTGVYRIGLYIEQSTARFVRILPRKDIYKYFPEK